jgi:hypothetical protein
VVAVAGRLTPSGPADNVRRVFPPPSKPGDVEVRASDGERETVVEWLRGAAAEGRLTYEELADRVEIAHAARSRAELERVTADLPAARPAAAILAAPSRVTSVFGDITRAGAWVVPASSRWRATFGDIRIDLRGALVTEPEMTFDVRTAFGDIDLFVPEGVLVEVRARTVFGDVRQDAGGIAPAGAPRVVLVGGTVFGDVRVRAKRLRERVLAALSSGVGSGR